MDAWIKRKGASVLSYSDDANAVSTGRLSKEIIHDIVRKVNPTYKQESKIQNFFQRAWHGSPYRFEKFDLGAIGF